MNIIISKSVEEGSKESLMLEVARLRAKLAHFNIYEIPSPKHIDRREFATRDEYKAAKEQYFKNYRDEFNHYNERMKRCENLITEICRSNVNDEYQKQKIAGVIKYSADEQEQMKDSEELKVLSKSASNAKYYHTKGKERLVKIEALKLKKKMWEERRALPAELKNSSLYNTAVNRGELLRHLNKTREIIKPLCLCGKRCLLSEWRDIKAHPTLQKHQLFKSVIKYIHYKRQFNSIKKAVGEVNFNVKDFKRVVRIKRDDGVSFTRTKMSEKEAIEYYNDECQPMNEGLVPPLRTPYIERVKYTEDYRLFVLELRMRVLYLRCK